MIKTVIFDIGNVLTDFSWEEFYKEKGYSPEIRERLGKATVKTPDWSELDRGVMTEEEIIRRFVEHDPEIEKEIRESLVSFKGIVGRKEYAIPWIKELKAKGLQVLVLSNFPDRASKECADTLDFLEYVDGGILSYQDKVIKPEPAIYALLIQRYNLNPDECVFIDDSQRNIDAAKKWGIHTIHWEKGIPQSQIHKQLEEILK